MFALSYALARYAFRALSSAPGGGYTPSLDLSDAHNSQYLTLMF
jgi:hypothetical protein